MPSFTNPSEIARETLKTLAARRLPPNPENYQTIYQEISGVKSPLVQAKAEPIESEVKWSELIRELLRQWDLKQSGITTARKKEGLGRVLSNFSKDSALLFSKLQALVASWGDGSQTQADGATDAIEPDSGGGEQGVLLSASASTVDISLDDIPGALREMLAQTIQTGVAPRLSQFPDLRDEALLLAQQTRDAHDFPALQGVTKKLKQFWITLELRNDSDAQVQDGLVRLLRLLVDNISELLLDDKWLSGQIAMMQDIISKPLDSRVLFDAERSFKEVIFKQGHLKQSLMEARATIKNMMTTFVGRMSEVTASTGEYHNKIERYAEEIGQTEDINKLNHILGNLMKDTRGMQLDMMRSRDELEDAHRQVKEAEEKILHLEEELDHVSELVYEDHLTGTLNRRGMEDAFSRELARADRLNSPLCVAMLDIDHFKRLNDTYGHETGDDALVHLVRVTKEALRPTDVIARFGGEEFVIILPDTPQDVAIEVMTRVQRQLTKNFFMHDNQRVLITFSAGVSSREDGEGAESLISRADKALYQAKQAGRNRVLPAS